MADISDFVIGTGSALAASFIGYGVVHLRNLCSSQGDERYADNAERLASLDSDELIREYDNWKRYSVLVYVMLVVSVVLWLGVWLWLNNMNMVNFTLLSLISSFTVSGIVVTSLAVRQIRNEILRRLDE